MVKIQTIILLFFLINFITSTLFSCPKTNEPPQDLEINSKFSFKPIDYKDNSLTPVLIGNKVLVNKNTHYVDSIKDLYSDSDYCPENYIILKKEELESIISELGDNAYSKFTEENGLNMKEKIYYVTNTKGNGDYNKMFMYLENNSITFKDIDPVNAIYDTSQKYHCICMLKVPTVKLEFPKDKRDFDFNEEVKFQTSFNNYYNGYLWRINEQIYTEEILTLSLKETGVNKIEFWGKYINGQSEYLCDIFYVSEEKVSSNQDYDDSKVKRIETTFQMHYNNTIHFTQSNSPVAPRNDGGYYIAVSNTEKVLHILSYDKNDNLIKDFDTEEKAIPHDITATNYGFAVYVVEADNLFHSYLTVYNKKFEKINRLQIMNNNADDKLTDSTPEKQLIRYNSKGEPEFGIRFIYQADNAKLLYSRGRIFLIFAHYNYFTDDNTAHTADTVATFNDVLLDKDFGLIWGASHSLIQSATFDKNYFWSASLSDCYPEGIKVQYTSKRYFQNNFDAVNNKNNIRYYGQNDKLAGAITGYKIGWADGKLGGILYFEKLKLYCLVYAKTPNKSEDEKNGKTIIYLTTWKFEDKQIKEEKIQEIKVFETGNIMQIRGGKFGNDKVFIIYEETTSSGHNNYGNIPKGSIPKAFIIKLPDFEIIKNDEKIDSLLMNTNEDLRTFRDGVLIWATSDSNNNLVINKIGTPRLDSANDHSNYALTSNDLYDEANYIINNIIYNWQEDLKEEEYEDEDAKDEEIIKSDVPTNKENDKEGDAKQTDISTNNENGKEEEIIKTDVPTNKENDKEGDFKQTDISTNKEEDAKEGEIKTDVPTNKESKTDNSQNNNSTNSTNSTNPSDTEKKEQKNSIFQIGLISSILILIFILCFKWNIENK